jgi:hypothetical protein
VQQGVQITVAAGGNGHRDDELVPTDPGQQVSGVRAGLEPTGHRDQQRVPDVVPQLVVDVLEPVEVDEHHGQAPAGAGQAQADLMQVLEEGGPVEQPGQLVLAGPAGHAHGQRLQHRPGGQQTPAVGASGRPAQHQVVVPLFLRTGQHGLDRGGQGDGRGEDRRRPVGDLAYLGAGPRPTQHPAAVHALLEPPSGQVASPGFLLDHHPSCCTQHVVHLGAGAVRRDGHGWAGQFPHRSLRGKGEGRQPHAAGTGHLAVVV